MSTDPRIGTELAGYRIESLLGRGGMSVVYLAEQQFPRRKVALKLLAAELAEDEGFRERFIRESDAAASLDHPNVVPIYGAGEVDGVLYIAMRYVEGSDLRRLLDELGRVDPIRTASILSQAADALDAAHQHALIHRDVKPGNILLAKPSGSGSIDHVYVSDFGLTKREAGGRDLTKTGQILGSVDYIAPEQVQGQPVDGRADVYSLGCVLYECLAGEPPFPSDVEAAALWAHVHEKPPRVTTKRPELPEGIDGVVAKAMAKSPKDRYATCGELAGAARTELGVPTGEALVVSPGRRWGRRRVVAALLAGVVVAAAGGFALTRAGGASKPGAGFTGCEVTDSPNVNDKSFNQAAYEGLTRATADLGINTSVRVSKSQTDYAPNIQASIDQGCSLIVTTGFVIQAATVEAATANPDQDFAVVDPAGRLPHNVQGLAFQTDQAAFLAGYLAAGVTRTGRIGTFGGLDIPPVTLFMDGFAAGILKYNLDTGSDVQLLGWDPATRVGTFVSTSPSTAFFDQAAAARIARAFISEGADVILPVAGGAGLGAARAARAAHGVLLVGVDTDQFLSAPEFGPPWLTSIRKRIDVAVEAAMKKVVAGTFEGGTYVGTLENGGVDLAPFHDLGSRVPQPLQDQLTELKAGIIDGSISVDPKDYLSS